MAYSETGRVWNDYLTNVNKTISLSKTANQTCEDTIKCMWLIDSQIFKCVVSRWGKKKLPNHQTFVSAFYRRNMIYLQSCLALASIGFINPSSNLCRTVFESLLRGYLFIVESEEADEYFQVINTPNEQDYNFKKGASVLMRKLYTQTMEDDHKEFV